MPSPTVRDVHQDAVLTNISIMYRNAEYIADQIFPVVPVRKKSDVYYVFSKSNMFRDQAAVRAPGGKARRIDYTLSSSAYDCIQYALSELVPDEVVDNADAPLSPMVDAAEHVADQLLLSRERRVAAYITGSTAWAYAATPTTAWTADTSDPVGDIMDAINGVVSSTGRRPNVAVMSWDVWRHLEQHPDLLDRVKYTRPGATLSVDDLRGWFGFNKVLIGYSLYDSALEGQSASMSYIWEDDFWCGFVPSAPALRTPSAGYIFEWGARQSNTYRLDEEHSTLVEVLENVDEVITGSDLGAIVYNAI